MCRTSYTSQAVSDPDKRGPQHTAWKPELKACTGIGIAHSIEAQERILQMLMDFEITTLLLGIQVTIPSFSLLMLWPGG